MEMSANMRNEYPLYNSICFTDNKEESISNFYPTETELLKIYNNPVHRRFLLDKLAPELNGSLLFQFLNQSRIEASSPKWQYTLLNYRHPVLPEHTESDRWILSLDFNLKILHQIRHIQKRVLECIDPDVPCNVLCFGVKAVPGLPELVKLGRILSIYCVENDQSLINELAGIYTYDPAVLESHTEALLNFQPDRKYDIIIYPSGKTWQETEKIQMYLQKLRFYWKSEKGRVLSY